MAVELVGVEVDLVEEEVADVGEEMVVCFVGKEEEGVDGVASQGLSR